MTDSITLAPTDSAGEVLDRTAIYIDGQWVPSDGQGRTEVVDPATEQVIAVVAEGTASDVDRAVRAAKAAFPAWAALSAAERADHLQRVADGLPRGPRNSAY